MKQLNRSLLDDTTQLSADVKLGKISDMPEKVIQFGEGNFLRAFVDWMIDEMNQQGLFNGRVVIVQPIPKGLVHVLNEQDGLYTLILRGIQNGEINQSKQIITSVNRGINPYEDWDEVIKCMQNPDLRFLFSNTTEAGISYVNEQYTRGKCQDSFPAKVTALLYERFKAFNGDTDKGLVIIPCELIDQNGDKLRKIILSHIKLWGIGEKFTNWIIENNYFLNTLVDRIVPGYPKKEADELFRQLGYNDRLLDFGEIFHLWVIEGPGHLAEELPFHRAGLNVIWTDDMTPYRTRKVRILNGAHTSSVLAAYHGGLNTVREMMEDNVFGPFVEKTVFNEILPTIILNEHEKKSYARSVLERFKNPFIRHELLSISLNSVSKWKVRVLPTFMDYHKTKNRLPECLTFSMANLIYFYKGNRTADGNYRGKRNGTEYNILDDSDVLEFFDSKWKTFHQTGDTESMVSSILANKIFWDKDLTLIPGFTASVTKYLNDIINKGTRSTARALIE